MSVCGSEYLSKPTPFALDSRLIAPLRVSTEKRPPDPLIKWIDLYQLPIEVDRSVDVRSLTAGDM
jgi:hypothetical protein